MHINWGFISGGYSLGVFSGGLISRGVISGIRTGQWTRRLCAVQCCAKRLTKRCG